MYLIINVLIVIAWICLYLFAPMYNTVNQRVAGSSPAGGANQRVTYIVALFLLFTTKNVSITYKTTNQQKKVKCPSDNRTVYSLFNL